MKTETRCEYGNSEHGGAGVKFLIVLVVLFLIGHAGFNYIPVAFAGADLKEEMRLAVVQGMAPARGEKPIDLVTKKIKSAVAKSSFPEAAVKIKMVRQLPQANVNFTRKVNILPFGLYQYEYVFNETASPSGLLF